MTARPPRAVASEHQPRTLTSALTDLYRSRGLLLGLLAVTVGVLVMILAPQNAVTVTQGPGGTLIVGSPSNLLSRLHVGDVGLAIFQVGLTITIFQVLLDQVAADRFVEQVKGVIVDQEEQVQHAVAQSLAAADHLDQLNLAPRELDKVIQSAAQLRTGSPELGAVIAQKLRAGVFDTQECWRNLVVRVEILRLDRARTTGREHDYYDVYCNFGYHTTNVRRTRFAFRVARWRDEYDRFLRDHELGAVWRLPSTGEFDDTWSEGFQLDHISFGGRAVTFDRNDIEREYVATAPMDQLDDRPEVFVQYAFTAKVLADGNLMSFEVPKPTFAATYSVSIAVDDIERVRAFDYFGATRPAAIEYSPSVKETRVVGVSVDDWILPKAGVIVVWNRKAGVRRARERAADDGGAAQNSTDMNEPTSWKPTAS